LRQSQIHSGNVSLQQIATVSKDFCRGFR